MVDTKYFGAIGELTACRLFLKHNYEVFRSVSSHCSCDLTVSDGEHSLSVEVRRAKREKSGRLTASLVNKAHIVAVIDYTDKMTLIKGIYFTNNIYINFPKLKIKD